MRSLKNKSQISVIIIIGIVLLFGIIILFYVFKDSNDKDNISLKQVSRAEYNKIKDCIDVTSTTSLYYNFLQGGYYDVIDPSINYYPVKIPYYFKEEMNHFPEINLIESEIEKYLYENLNECNKNLIINEIDVKINENNIEFNYDIPIYIKEGETTAEYKYFSKVINCDFYEKHSHVKEFLMIQEKYPEYFPLGYLTELAIVNDFNFEILEISEDTKIITFVLNAIDERGPLTYNFALGYKNETK